MSSSATSKTSNAYHGWLVWFCGALFFFYEFCLQSSPSVMVPELMKAFNVNAGQLGKLSGIYFYAYALMQLPVGLLLDRYGPRVMMTVACFICALGSFIFSQTHTLVYAELARFFMGLGSACAFISALKLATLWFPANRFALLSGLLVMFGMLGAIGGQVPLSHFVHHYGWRSSMEILSYTGFVLAFLFYLMVRNGPFSATSTESGHVLSLDGLKRVLGNGQIWLLALYAALMFAPTPAFGELWGVPFIVGTFGVPRELAAKVVSLLFVGWVVGCPLFGYLSDRAAQRMPYMRFGCWASLGTMLVIVFFGSKSLLMLGIGLFFFGLFSSAFVLAFSLAKEAVLLCYAATAVGFLNMLNEFLPGLLQGGMGDILDYCWSGKMQEGIRVYASQDYYHASFSLLAVIVGALIVLHFIRVEKEK